jgi:hypothetical protein
MTVEKKTAVQTGLCAEAVIKLKGLGSVFFLQCQINGM